MRSTMNIFVLLLVITTICVQAETECYTANGVDYEGVQSHIESPLSIRSNFTPCVMWNETGISMFEGLPENYCRNSNNSVFPWCFVRHEGQLQFHLCDIPSCKTPAYRGCYRPNILNNSVSQPLMNGRHSLIGDPKMKIARCLNFCRSRDYTYAGLKNGHSCFCSKWATLDEREAVLDADQNRLPESNCKKHCINDPIHACGGENAISIYDTRAGMCGNKYMNENHGTIYSPRWPGRYAHNLTCSWTIFILQPYANSPDYQIVFSFVYFDLGRSNDTLTIDTTSRLIAGQPNHVGGFRGSVIPSDVIVPLTRVKMVFLQFVSDHEKARNGFTIKYKVQRVPTSTTTTEATISTTAATVADTTAPPRASTSPTTPPVDVETSHAEPTEPAVPASPSNHTTSSETHPANLPADGPEPKATKDHSVVILFIGIAIAVVILSMAVVLVVTGALKRRHRKAKEAKANRPPVEFNNPVSFSNESKTVTGV
ncbi:kremen protein 1-like [Ciona intestinalis]